MPKYLMAPVMAMALAAGPALAQEAAQPENIDEASIQSVELSAAELIETKNTMSIITQEVIERKNASNIFEALKMEPGIMLSSGSGVGSGQFRRSSEVNIRGFDQSRIGIFLDGIPLLNTWGREFDIARISAFDIDSIEVSKGYSSVLLGGGNSMGGIIDIRTAKPTEPLEFKAKYKNYFDRDMNDMAREYGATIAAKQDHFYLKAAYFEKKTDFFRSSAKSPEIRDGNGELLYKKGGKWDAADNKDRQINFAAGWTPNEDVDIMFGYMKHDGEKGAPISYRQGVLWDYDWPSWDTERTYVAADINLTDKSYLKGTLYYDTHVDHVNAWRFIGGSWVFNDSWSSKFDDEAWGARLEYGYTFNDKHKLALSGNYRTAEHKRKYVSTGFLNRQAEADYLDLGAEYTYKPMEPMTMVFGLGYDSLKIDSFKRRANSATAPTIKSRNGLPDLDAVNWQLGVFYDLTPEHELHFTYARKTNMPSMQDMLNNISAASPIAVTWLDPEVADHFEFGYKGDINGWLQLQANIFYSLVRDAFGDDPNDPDITVNVGQVAYSGYELGLTFPPETSPCKMIGMDIVMRRERWPRSVIRRNR